MNPMQSPNTGVGRKLSACHDWEFDSHPDVHTLNRGPKRPMQVWSRPSLQWPDTREWVITEDNALGRENPPKPGCGFWTSTEAFKQAFPHFDRSDTKQL